MNKNQIAAEQTALEFYQKLFQWIYPRVSNQEDAREILQDVFLKLSKNSTAINQGKVRAWLYSTAKNSIIDYYRKKGHQTDNKNFTDSLIGQDQLFIDELDGEHNVSLCLEPLLKKMNPQESDLLKAIDMSGQSQKDRATKAGLPYSSLKSQVQRAREKLKEALLSCCQLTLNTKGFPVDFEPPDSCC